jgi:hypothetical protein
LKPGLTIREAQQHLDALAAQLAQTYPKEYPATSKWSLRLEPVQESLTGSVRPTLVLFGRRRIRFADGCRQYGEPTCCALIRSHARVGYSSGSGRLAGALDPAIADRERHCYRSRVALAAMLVLALTKTSLLALMPADLPRLAEVHFDARVIGLACALSLLTGILFGLTPALHASRTDPNLDLKEGTRGGTASRRQNRFRGALVATEVALSVVLLSGAAILLHSFWNTLRVNPGFDPEGLLVARIWIPFPNNPAANKYLTAPSIAALSREILRQAKTLPGIEAVVMGGDNSVPLVNNSLKPIAFMLPDQPDSAAEGTLRRVRRRQSRVLPGLADAFAARALLHRSGYG